MSITVCQTIAVRTLRGQRVLIPQMATRTLQFDTGGALTAPSSNEVMWAGLTDPGPEAADVLLTVHLDHSPGCPLRSEHPAVTNAGRSVCVATGRCAVLVEYAVGGLIYSINLTPRSGCPADFTTRETPRILSVVDSLH